MFVFFASEELNKYILWTCNYVIEALVYRLQLFRQHVGCMLMGTNCARPLVVDLCLFCYERDVMRYLAQQKQNDMIDAFNSTSI